MGRFMVKLSDDEYLEWSTVVDAPVTEIMDAEHTKKYMQAACFDGNGRRITHEDWKVRWDFMQETGSTMRSWPEDIESLLRFNRAGPEESRLTTIEDFRRFYAPGGPHEVEGEIYYEPVEDDPAYKTPVWRTTCE